MFIHTYKTPKDFVNAARYHNGLILSAYSRVLPDGHITGEGSLTSKILSSIPILGTIRGLARLYSIWSVKDRSRDPTTKLIKHTIIGVLETLGLGVVYIALDIVITVLAILACMFLMLYTLAHYCVTKLIPRSNPAPQRF
ncbi:hypothetical protein [Chlamydia felis Fe/C-56]|uniref:Uncharacterized protein n=1 Tax=Chlamydia felis (strain Fe/C-56) TaxID=264202 RepID=Q254U4_CHLFF|nr:hypothetical protein [Chlamydia felis]BAE81194.1 hypothetical protein [Chlamydia felis Fe/C-56]